MLKTIVKLLFIFNLIHSLASLTLDDIDRSDIPTIVESRGFICETHYMTTSDGYILGNYRIVNPFSSKYFSKPLKPLIVQSGFLGSAVDFIINAPNGFIDEEILASYNDLDSIDFENEGRNLGFILANLGYDVWLTNPRGNYYSSNHTTLDPKLNSTDFWSFSLDEMALTDLPEMIDYVLKETGQSTVGYIGFSRASLIMFAMLSDKPEYSDKISPYIALAPPVYLNNFNTPLKYLAATQFVANYVRDHPGSCFNRALSEVATINGICNNIIIKPICDIIKLNLVSIDTATANASRVDIYLSHLPAGASCWDFIHFAQRMIKTDFTHIDLGTEMNLQRYGTETAPVYDLGNIKNQNIIIFHSTGDETANPTDVQRLIDQLQVPLVDLITIEDEKFSHLDFLFDNNVGLLVNKRIAQILQRYRS